MVAGLKAVGNLPATGALHPVQHLRVNKINPGLAGPGKTELFFDNEAADGDNPVWLKVKGIVPKADFAGAEFFDEDFYFLHNFSGFSQANLVAKDIAGAKGALKRAAVGGHEGADGKVFIGAGSGVVGSKRGKKVAGRKRKFIQVFNKWPGGSENNPAAFFESQAGDFFRLKTAGFFLAGDLEEGHFAFANNGEVKMALTEGFAGGDGSVRAAENESGLGKKGPEFGGEFRGLGKFFGGGGETDKAGLKLKGNFFDPPPAKIEDGGVNDFDGKGVFFQNGGQIGKGKGLVDGAEGRGGRFDEKDFGFLH